MAKGQILIVEDDADIRQMLATLLSDYYDVLTASNGDEAILKLKSATPDLTLLDLSMPFRNGLQTCEWIRNDHRFNNMAIMMLTAMGSEENELTALDLGADDFIRKPITPSVLLSRVKNLLKRYAPAQNEKQLQYNSLTISPEQHLVIYNGKELQMPRKEFQLLYVLAQNQGKVLDRNYLLQEVWGNEVIVGDRTVDVHIRKIRQKLDDKFIVTLKGIGYKFVPE